MIYRVMKTLVLSVALGFMFGLGSAALVTPTVAEAHGGDGCCKHCRTGKPCGDSCIPLNKDCHQPPGCAC